MTSRPEDLNFGEEKYIWRAVTDGTVTRAEIIDPDDEEVYGRGVARRAKGDARNEALGVALATARALEEAAEYHYERATDLGWGQARISFTQEEAAALKEALAAIVKAMP